MPLSPLAAGYDQFILDLDGCIWIGGEALPGATGAVEELRGAGKRIVQLGFDWMPPEMPGTPAWYATTARIANARRPWMSRR